MIFEEWWKEAMARFKIPQTAFFCDFGKTIAEIAWEIGFQEGRRKLINESIPKNEKSIPGDEETFNNGAGW